jgi:hypothetical protein
MVSQSIPSFCQKYVVFNSVFLTYIRGQIEKPLKSFPSKDETSELQKGKKMKNLSPKLMGQKLNAPHLNHL